MTPPTNPDNQALRDDVLGASAVADQALVSDQAATRLAPPGFDPSRCRNCNGCGWVCENHQDKPWGLLTAIGCECGAGAPCPVCERDMACAPYAPHWGKGTPRLTDETVLVVFMPTELNSTYQQQPYTPTAIPAYFDENGLVCDSGTWKPDPGIQSGKWEVAAWMRMPEPPPWLCDNDGNPKGGNEVPSRSDDSVGPKDIAND